MTVGLLTDDIPADQPARQQGLIPYPTDSVWSGQDWAGLSHYVMDAVSRGIIATGADPVSGLPVFTPSAAIGAQEANERFGIPGALKFDGPINPDVAESLSQEKRSALFRADAAERAAPGIGTATGRLGAGFVAGALDPLNAGLSFVPVVGEARMAGWLAAAGSSALARAGVRVGAGAISGMAGQTVLEPLNYLRAQSEQDDYSATNALLDLGFGAALGGGLHTLVGGIGDALGSHFVKSTVGKLVASDPEAREAALRTSVAQVAEGRPVEVAPVLDAAARDPADALPSGSLPDARTAEALRDAAGRPAPTDLAASDAAASAAAQAPETLPGRPGWVADFIGELDDTEAGDQEAGASGVAAKIPPRPQDLVDFLARSGGLEDQGGELGAMNAERRIVPFAGRLVAREGGMKLDAAREAAEEAGFLKPGSDINDLLDALDRNLRGEHVFSRQDENAALDWQESMRATRQAPEGHTPASEAEMLEPGAAQRMKHPFEMSQEELYDAAAEKRLSDKDKLVRALGAEGARRFKELDRAQNNAFDMHRADRAAEEFEKRFGIDKLTSEQQRLVYGIGETDWQADDLEALHHARDDLTGAPLQEVARGMTLAMLKVSAKDLRAFMATGEGEPAVQIAAARIQAAMEEMARRNVSREEIDRATSAAMEARGFSHADATEVLSDFRGQRGGRDPASPDAAMGDRRLAPPEPAMIEHDEERAAIQAEGEGGAEEPAPSPYDDIPFSDEERTFLARDPESQAEIAGASAEAERAALLREAFERATACMLGSF